MAVNVFKYNGKDLPDFVRVTGLSYSALSDIAVKESVIPQARGNRFGGIERGGGFYRFSVKLITTPTLNLMELRDQLKTFVRGSGLQNLDKLVLMEKPNRYYEAVLSNDIDISDLFTHGEGELEFYVPDNVAYSLEEFTATAVDGTASISYDGLEDVSAVTEVVVEQDCTLLEIEHSPSFNKLILNGDFKKGQTVALDSRRKIVQLDGSTAMQLLNFKSRWFHLTKGANKVTVTSDATIKHRLTVGYRKAF